VKDKTMSNFSAQFAQFVPAKSGAFATSRCLPNGLQDTHQEWCERGTINGENVSVYWIFTNEEASVEDGADMPFDADHIDRIVSDEE
jgi:hypothetical protein